MASKIIAVFGATGAQGGGLARAILRDKGGDFLARAITRKPESDNAKALAAQGAEIVKADLDDPESVKNAMSGAYGAYCVTNFWEHFSAEKETTQGKTLAEAAKAAGIQHAIWSTFEDVRDYVPLDDDRMPTLHGRHKVPHFEGKADANRYFEQLGVPTTFFYTSGYFENLIGFGWGPQRGEDGNLYLVFPTGDEKLPLIAAEDIGKCAYGIFKAGKAYIGKTLGVAGEHLTGSQLAANLTESLGKPVAYSAVSPDVYRGFDFPGADDVGNMFQFWRDFPQVYGKNRNVEESRRLNPELRTFSEWLKDNGKKIPIPD